MKNLLKRYFIDAMSAMALGLFATLLIGTIFDTIGTYIPKCGFMLDIAKYAKAATGMAIGAAIANSLGAHPLVMFSCTVVGYASYAMGATINSLTYTAGPAGSFIAVIVACEIGMLVSKKTKVDILVTPIVTILTGYLVAWLVCSPVAYAMYYLGSFINTATVMQPFFMGIIISVVVGMILTLPISSAAICAMIGITGLAGGAATVGCCAQMVGFAVISFRENRWGGVLAQGLGTSMLQMGNICRKPVIWLAPTLAAAVCGPISTMLFRLECSGVSAGMGTCGLVGPLGVLSAMAQGGLDWHFWIGMPVCCIILPAVLSLAFNEAFRKLGWIKNGDMKLHM